MIKQISNSIRIKTEPLNWGIQVLKGTVWKDEAFFETMDQAKAHIISELSDDSEKDMIFDKFCELATALNLKDVEEFSAWHLTNVVKHPEFVRKQSSKSLKNLKPRRITSNKFAFETKK
jgi:hypothetical protein